MLVVFVPYVLFLVLRPRTIARLPLPPRVHTLLATASSEAGMEGDEIEAELEEFGGVIAPPRSWRPVLLMAPSLAIIVLGATLVVQSSLVLGGRWGVPTVLVGVTALAAATSLPNAYAAIRLAMDGHGAAVVSATFNSNTLNLIAGIAVPAALRAEPWCGCSARIHPLAARHERSRGRPGRATADAGGRRGVARGVCAVRRLCGGDRVAAPAADPRPSAPPSRG